MKRLHLLPLCCLLLLTGCASTSQSKKFFKQARVVSVETQYTLKNTQGLTPAQVTTEEQSRWKLVQPAVENYESGFLNSFKSICRHAADEKDVAPIYDYADTLRTQEREVKALGDQNGLNVSPEVKLPSGETMPIPDYVQHVAREAAPVIKSDSDNALQNEEGWHALSNLNWGLSMLSRGLR
jgi:hypothetical protein